MNSLKDHWRPTERQLRQFGWLCLPFFPLLGWLWSGEAQIIAWLFGIGTGMATTGFLLPRALLPFYLGLLIVAYPLGLIVREIFLLLIFFGVFLPIGMVFRLMRRDALHRAFEKNRESYWEIKKTPEDAASYYRQW